jgi:predicted DNA-binding transcriptional regulator YafY
MAEEQGSVTLPDAEARVGVDAETLRSVLDAVLYLSFRAQSNEELIDETYAFSFDEERQRLSIDGAHWPRDMRSTPPSPLSALELLLAGLVISHSSAEPDAALDAALNKLEPLVGTVVIHLPEPPCLEAVRDGLEEETTVAFRYLKPGAREATHREIEPYKVFRKFGSWYVYGRDRGDGKRKYFRIDLMADAAMTRTRFTPPSEEIEVPAEFAYTQNPTTVSVAVPERLRNLLADDYTVREMNDLGDGRVAVVLDVMGDDRLDYLLLRLGAAAEWADPELRSRRADLSERILAEYEG